MVKIADCKTDIQFKGTMASDLMLLAETGGWSKARSEAFTRIEQDVRANSYRTFSSNAQTIGLQRMGQAAVFAVPTRQKGALASFAGKYVHIVCMGYSDKHPSFSGRVFAVAEVSEQGVP